VRATPPWSRLKPLQHSRSRKPTKSMVAAAGFEPVLPKAGMQILSPPNPVLPKLFCGHAFRSRSEIMPMTSAEMH